MFKPAIRRDDNKLRVNKKISPPPSTGKGTKYLPMPLGGGKYEKGEEKWEMYVKDTEKRGKLKRETYAEGGQLNKKGQLRSTVQSWYRNY